MVELGLNPGWILHPTTFYTVREAKMKPPVPDKQKRICAQSRLWAFHRIKALRVEEVVAKSGRVVLQEEC